MIAPHRLALFIALVLPLIAAGCSTLAPEAQCFADATIDYRGAWRGAQTIRADLDRGYALHVQQIRVPQAVPCRVAGARGTCLANGRQKLTTPVAIDRAALTERLVALEAKMDALRPAAMTAAAPCGYGDWAGGQSAAPTAGPAPAPP